MVWLCPSPAVEGRPVATPTDEELLALWTTFVADRLIVNEFAGAVLPALIARLTAALPTAHPHDVVTAAEDTLLAFLKHPERFDPNRSRLLSYLLMAARCDFLNRQKGERRHHRGRIPWDSVELDAGAWNSEEEEDAREDDGVTFDRPEVQAAVASLSEPDRRVLDLMRAGERQTAAFAGVLGVDDQPVAEQETVVKRAKDRIKARLRRAVGGSDG